MIPSYTPVTQTPKQSTPQKTFLPNSTPKFDHLVTFCVAELHEKAAIVRPLSNICKGWRITRLLRALHLGSHSHVMLGAGKRMRQRHKKIREEKSLLIILFPFFASALLQKRRLNYC